MPRATDRRIFEQRQEDRMKDNSRKELAKWQERLDRNMSAYGAELLKMDEREAQYN